MTSPPELSGRIASLGVRVSLVLAAAGIAGLIAAGVGLWPVVLRPLGVLLLLAAVGNAAFFRNPRRAIPEDERSIVSPGDGRVVEVVELDAPDAFVGPCRRVAVFLSVFNVHVNRSPVAGKVRAIQRKGSRFLAAFDKRASDLNVQSRMEIEAPDGRRYACVQITGLIARRIVSYVDEGDTLERGGLYGLICYGSRMELYVPADCEVRVAVGDRVKGGSSVIAQVPA